MRRTYSTEEQEAYEAGKTAGENLTGLPLYHPSLLCPHDGRTKLGRAWWEGYMAGDRNRVDRHFLAKQKTA